MQGLTQDLSSLLLLCGLTQPALLTCMQGLTKDLSSLLLLCGLQMALVANDVVSNPVCPELQSICAQGATAVVLVPITARGQLLGGLLALSAVPDTFDYYYCKVRPNS